LLDSIDTVLQWARTMTWNGKHPIVALVTTTYHTGVKLTQAAMEAVEAQIKRLPALGKWCVDLVPPALAIRDA
jgi:DDE family transposase